MFMDCLRIILIFFNHLQTVNIPFCVRDLAAFFGVDGGAASRVYVVTMLNQGTIWRRVREEMRRNWGEIGSNKKLGIKVLLIVYY